MKKYVLLCALLFSVALMAQEEKSFTVKGSFKNFTMPVPVWKVYLSYRQGDKSVTDSLEPKDGSYSFSGKTVEPMMAQLRVKFQPGADGKPTRMISGRDFAVIFISPGNVEVSSLDSFSNVTVKGSKAHDEYLKLNNLLKPVNEQMRSASAIYSQAAKDKNEPARKAAENTLDSLDKVTREVYGAYVKNNLQSPIASYALSNYAGWEINVAEVEPLLNQLPAAQRNYPSVKTLTDNVAIAKKTSVGAIAMDFTQNDTLGVPVKLSSLRGKYLLVDFWASWCGPCRRENPNVVKAYQAYKDKGFHILGVSLDQPGAKDKWLEAIHKDGLTWTHVSDLKYWQNDVAKLYGIQAIPQNLLLDPTGKIIAKNLNGEELQKKLAEILKP